MQLRNCFFGLYCNIGIWNAILYKIISGKKNQKALQKTTINDVTTLKKEFMYIKIYVTSLMNYRIKITKYSIWIHVTCTILKDDNIFTYLCFEQINQTLINQLLLRNQKTVTMWNKFQSQEKWIFFIKDFKRPQICCCNLFEIGGNHVCRTTEISRDNVTIFCRSGVFDSSHSTHWNIRNRWVSFVQHFLATSHLRTHAFPRYIVIEDYKLVTFRFKSSNPNCLWQGSVR